MSTIRIIATVPFVVHSPSLYEYHDERRRITIKYTNIWTISLETPDGKNTYHEFSTLAEIISVLEKFVQRAA